MSNTIVIIGRLTKDPESKDTSGGMIAKFSVACDNEDRDKTTTYFNCTAFGKSAEFVTKYLTKGRLVAVTGSHKSNKGSDDKTYWNVDVSKVKGLDRAKDDAPASASKSTTVGAGTDTYSPWDDE
jgi:single-strand DNA-binding protein